MPFDILKIDRSFVRPLEQPGSSLLVRAMTWIAQGRTMQTVGEGVETVGQLSALREAGCDFVQGFLFTPPIERQALSALEEMEQDFIETVGRAVVASRNGDAPMRGGSPLRPRQRRPSALPRPQRNSTGA